MMLQLASIIALASSPTDPLTTRLRAIAVDRASFYSCKIAVSVQTATESFAAASDDQVDERFVWGSVTKLLTGAGVLRAVETKKLDLDQPAAVRRAVLRQTTLRTAEPRLWSLLGCGAAAHRHNAGQTGPASYACPLWRQRVEDHSPSPRLNAERRARL
jgi:hypothetical protein